MAELGFTSLYWAVVECTGLYWTVLGCTRLYWAVLGCTGLYWAVLGRTGIRSIRMIILTRLDFQWRGRLRNIRMDGWNGWDGWDWLGGYHRS